MCQLAFRIFRDCFNHKNYSEADETREHEEAAKRSVITRKLGASWLLQLSVTLHIATSLASWQPISFPSSCLQT